jgi:hypothetical protein
MFQNNVKIQWMDESTVFGTRLGQAIANAGTNPRKVSMATGVDYPYLTKLINYPEKYVPSVDVLKKLATIPFLKDLVEDELESRLLNDYDISIVADAMIKMLGRDTPKTRVIKQKMKALLDGQ